jgi:hypothetical protein
MATRKTTSVSTETQTKSGSGKAPSKQNKLESEKSGEELVIENFGAMSQVMVSLTETLDILVKKVESMACHIVATEEVLSEIVADNGLNIARVNARIRARFDNETDIISDASRVIDVAATIASPSRRR